jgi:hypothetical protein
MAHDFHLLYDSITLVPLVISGSEIIDVREGLLTCKLQESIAEDLITHKKSLHDYLVKANNGYAELIFKNSDLWHKKKTMPDDIVKDLNYRITFFSCLDIKFIIADKIKLYFDIDTIDISYQTNFKTVVNEQNSMAYFYITEFNNPTKLLTKFEINLLEFCKSKVLELDYSRPNISIWATRK